MAGDGLPEVFWTLDGREGIGLGRPGPAEMTAGRYFQKDYDDQNA